MIGYTHGIALLAFMSWYMVIRSSKKSGIQYSHIHHEKIGDVIERLSTLQGMFRNFHCVFVLDFKQA